MKRTIHLFAIIFRTIQINQINEGLSND